MRSSEITVLIPYQTGSRKDWLNEAIASIPTGTPYLVLENDGELAEALNEGLRQATTEYVVRLDADDLLHEESVQLLLDAAWDVDVAYPDMTLVDELLGVIGSHECGEFCPNRLQVWNYIGGAGSVMRRQTVLDVGGYRQECVPYEDWDLWVRLARAGKRFKNHRDATYFYRQRKDSISRITDDEAARLKALIVGDEPDLAATFYAQETVSTTYWRCLLPARHLPGQVILHRPEVGVDGDEITFPKHRGAAVWQFPGRNYERFSMAAMQETGIRCLIETDDNYLTTIPYGNTWMRGMPDPRSEQGLPSIEMHRRIAGWADGVIVTTEALAKQYRKFSQNVYVCPNQIDPVDWDDDPVKPDWYDPNITYIGAAASASHTRDMELVGRALEWASKRPNVEVVFMGVWPQQFYGRFPFRWVPWTTDLSAYRKIQSVLDIALCPVKENAWSVCRSDLKALESAMCGAVPVLSYTPPYAGWTDGERCRKAKSPADFLKVTRELLGDPGTVRELAAEARAYVLAERTVAGNIDKWREALEVG